MAIPAYVGASLDVNVNTIEDLLTRVNSLSSDLGTVVITTGNNSGDVVLTGNLTSTSISTDTISTSANLSISSTGVELDSSISATGLASLTGGASISGSTLVISTTSLSIASNTTITGDVDLNGNLSLGGSGYIYNTPNNSIGFSTNAYINGSLFIDGTVHFANTSIQYSYDTLSINNYLTSNTGTLVIEGDVSANGSITLTGDINATGSLSCDEITVSGNVDGYDVSVMGTKVDGIEAGADVTDETNVLAALDGATIGSTTLAAADKVLIQDINDSNNLRTCTAQDIADLASGVPAGVITAWIGGYFSDGSNGTYVPVLVSNNDIADANAYLNSQNWYVCDGSELNTGTGIFNGAGRYLPNLSDSRFIMGGTSVGGTGGSNSSAHTHSIDHDHGSFTSGATSLSTAQLAAHTHTYTKATKGSAASGSGADDLNTSTDPTSSTGSGSSHTHSVNPPAYTGTSGSASATENRPLYLSCLYIMKVA